MNADKRRIVTLLVRFQNAVEQANARAEEGYEHDSEFDAGEFSGPAMQRELEREHDRIARRLGFENASVASEAVWQLRADIPVADHWWLGR